MSNIHQIIRRPVVTEKTLNLKYQLNQVVFEVSRDANKLQIRQAVESLLGAKVEDVNTLIVRGKTKRVGRSIGRRSNWKKAVVTLKAGETIAALELLNSVPEEENLGEEA
jgi:large subunit ribosomal protein L23